MLYQEENEMTDLEIKVRYGMLIQEAAHAFGIDPNYAADIVRKAKNVTTRRNGRLTKE